ALARQLTADSSKEQASAGLDRLTPAELNEFTRLNDAYKAKFGFPFILAVKGRSKDDILRSFTTRMGNNTTDEFATALAEIERIARLRLGEILPETA
ncbi:MAG: 2-oxo-4-hydroxy-4-carboxy-5-ureidoimidazoline decarboxylase, partial [Methylobacterium sp.]|nr:2-oxo-4-hydroxy-4-carboxy-5-ureidoimidazoline decarboxylase [Methylobacterium sp.]